MQTVKRFRPMSKTLLELLAYRDPAQPRDYF